MLLEVEKPTFFKSIYSDIVILQHFNVVFGGIPENIGVTKLNSCISIILDKLTGSIIHCLVMQIKICH